VTIVFLDTETTSLRHDRRAWDIGLIIRTDDGMDSEHQFFIDTDDLDLGNADLMSLKIGRFYERHPQALIDAETVHYAYVDECSAMTNVEVATRAATIVGAVPWFDTDVLGQRMRANGILPSWHYHLVDVETLAAGRLRKPPPWGFDDLLAEYGLEYDEADRHTALGDARMVRDLYDVVLLADELLPSQAGDGAAAVVPAYCDGCGDYLQVCPDCGKRFCGPACRGEHAELGTCPDAKETKTA
jgi:hypothetical protein